MYFVFNIPIQSAMMSQADFMKLCMDGKIVDVIFAIADKELKELEDLKKSGKVKYEYFKGGNVPDLDKKVPNANNHVSDEKMRDQKSKHYWMLTLYEECMNTTLSNKTGKANYVDIGKLMIENGANHLNSGLYGACKGGYMDIVKLLIEKGADNWDWGLYGACLGGHVNIAELMIEKGAASLTFGLYGACQGGKMDTVKLMFEKKGADYGFGRYELNFGLEGARSGGSLEAVKFMIEKGADDAHPEFFKDIDSSNMLVKGVENKQAAQKESVPKEDVSEKNIPKQDIPEKNVPKENVNRCIIC